MTRFEVWAPRAERVDLVLGDRRVAMSPQPAGWHRTAVADSGPGSDYAYSLDGGDPLPDPRSPWQPHGIDGPSRLVDHGAFEWSDARWRGAHLPSAVVYELHVGTFTEQGTFEAAIEKLPHLVELGVDAVELLPVAEFSGDRGWGYDGVDLYAPHHSYGGPDGLKRLVDAAHGAGLGVVMDVVYNHLGPAGNYLSQFGPYFTDRYATPWGEAVNLDGQGSDEVRHFLVDNALMWLRDYHCDGLRLDAVHAIIDTSAVHLLEQVAVEVEELSAQLGRRLWVIAESDLNDPRLIWRREAGGYGLDAQWGDDFHHAVHAVLTGEADGYYADFGSLAQLAKALTDGYVYDGCYSAFRGRRHGRPHGGAPGWRFLGYAQNHDQVGNRAVGERLVHLAGAEKAHMAAALVLCSPFVPMLFMGEEWAASTPFLYFTDHADPELGRAVSEGRRREFAAFGWRAEDVPDPQAEATFSRSKLRWQERAAGDHGRLLEWHRRLIALRAATPDLRDGRLDRVACRFDEEEGWFVMERGAVALACNLAAGRQAISFARPVEVLLASTADVMAKGTDLEMPGAATAVVRFSPGDQG